MVTVGGGMLLKHSQLDSLAHCLPLSLSPSIVPPSPTKFPKYSSSPSKSFQVPKSPQVCPKSQNLELFPLSISLLTNLPSTTLMFVQIEAPPVWENRKRTVHITNLKQGQQQNKNAMGPFGATV